jgi:chemosensory pili system protein ChpA (sensor histidine kinase/response regulator)
VLLDTHGILIESSPTPAVPEARVRRHALIPTVAHAADFGDALTERTDDVQAEMLPVFTLGELLGFDQPLRERSYALVVVTDVGQAALLVDDLVEDLDILVQALPRHLQRQILRGTTVTPQGEVALLLDLTHLISGALADTRRRAAPRQRLTTPLAATLAPRVLVVDDSEAIRRTLDFQLSRAGFTVDLARDGIEALEVMLARLPRVLVLDAEMPRLDGFELLSVLRHGEQFQHVRVAMLTSRGSEKHRERALRLGAAAYLIKPCRQDTLVATIHTLLAEPTDAP